MPNTYNRPRWTIPYLLTQLRDRAPLRLLFFLAAFSLCAFVGTSLDHLGRQERTTLVGVAAGDALHQPKDLTWRDRAPAVISRPAMRAAHASGLFDAPGERTRAAEAGATLMQALATAYALATAVELLTLVGFKAGMTIRLGLLVLFTTCMLSAAWRFGPAPYLAAALAGLLRNAWKFRVDPTPLTGASALAWLLVGCFVDQTFVVLLPVVASQLLPPEQERHRLSVVLGSSALAVLVLGSHFHAFLRPEEQAYLLSQLSVGSVFRRFLGCAIGTGGSLLLAAPPVLLAILGRERLFAYDRRLAIMTLGSALSLLLVQLLVVRDPVELADPAASYAAFLPALLPAMAFGLLRLKEKVYGPALLVGIVLTGLTVQGSAFLFDPALPLRNLRERKAWVVPRVILPGNQELEPELVALDRRFTPELSDPALSLACARVYLFRPRSEQAIIISLADSELPIDLMIDVKGLTPRPWIASLLHWRPATETTVAGIGDRSTLQKLLGLLLASSLGLLFLLSVIFLGVRLRRFQEGLLA